MQKRDLPKEVDCPRLCRQHNLGQFILLFSYIREFFYWSYSDKLSLFLTVSLL